MFEGFEKAAGFMSNIEGLCLHSFLIWAHWGSANNVTTSLNVHFFFSSKGDKFRRKRKTMKSDKSTFACLEPQVEAEATNFIDLDCPFDSNSIRDREN